MKEILKISKRTIIILGLISCILINYSVITDGIIIPLMERDFSSNKVEEMTYQDILDATGEIVIIGDYKEGLYGDRIIEIMSSEIYKNDANVKKAIESWRQGNYDNLDEFKDYLNNMIN